jgi:hypothetical protein
MRKAASTISLAMAFPVIAASLFFIPAAKSQRTPLLAWAGFDLRKSFLHASSTASTPSPRKSRLSAPWNNGSGWKAFGALPPELRKRVNASAQVTAAFLGATRPGVRAGDILEMAGKWYAENGFPGELELHHQGGAIGYAEREWIAFPGSRELVHDHQAFAWNPIVQGALSFDTFIVCKDRLENINEVPGWPVIPVKAGAATIRLPDILVR